MKKLLHRLLYWYWFKRMSFKYGVVLKVYLFFFPKKFNDDQHIIYRGSIWRIYYCQKSFRPYYYHLYRESNSRYIHTALAEEQELLKLPPVILEFY